MGRDEVLEIGDDGFQRLGVAQGWLFRDLLVSKSVHSAFHGTPDLAAWLKEQGISGIAICGIQTNMCCETTARVGSDLGFEMIFVTDATHTFDLVGGNHQVYRAREIVRYTSLTLDADFGKVVSTAELVS